MLFGDERQDYEESLRKHYEAGPQRNRRERFVTSYAGSHPWEDWAETWAHYLHIVDTFETALSFGLDMEASLDIKLEPFRADVLYNPKDRGADSFVKLINSWTRLTAVLNELSRAMGLADFYPFVLSGSVVRKLHFIHMVVMHSTGFASNMARAA
jgi:hypothetical protein